jgi:hypothetical protein
MSTAALVLAMIGYVALAAAVLTDSTLLAQIAIALAVAGLLFLACDFLKTEGDLLKRLRAVVAATQSTRVFRSQLVVPTLKRGHVLLALMLPSTHIRLHFDMENPPLATRIDDDQRVKKMSRWLELYLLATTVLLFVLVYTQSHPSAWQLSWWGWILRVSAVLLSLLRIGEIFLQSVEVVLGRIDADPASGFATLLIYVLQAVAIFAIWSEYAAYASGYHCAFKPLPTNAWGYLYLAWANFVSFGATYPPQTQWATIVVVCSSVTFILLFSVLLSYVVSLLKN